MRHKTLVASVLSFVCFGLLPSLAQAMPYPDKVFTDPAVVELANACLDGKPDRIAALLATSC